MSDPISSRLTSRHSLHHSEGGSGRGLLRDVSLETKGSLTKFSEPHDPKGEGESPPAVTAVMPLAAAHAELAAAQARLERETAKVRNNVTRIAEQQELIEKLREVAAEEEMKTEQEVGAAKEALESLESKVTKLSIIIEQRKSMQLNMTGELMDMEAQLRLFKVKAACCFIAAHQNIDVEVQPDEVPRASLSNALPAAALTVGSPKFDFPSPSTWSNKSDDAPTAVQRTAAQELKASYVAIVEDMYNSEQPAALRAMLEPHLRKFDAALAPCCLAQFSSERRCVFESLPDPLCMPHPKRR